MPFPVGPRCRKLCISLDVKKGDEVIYSKYGGTEVKVEGEELLIMKVSDILAKVVKKK